MDLTIVCFQFDQVVEAGQKIKISGNYHFKKENYTLATNKYKKALRYLNRLHDGEEMSSEQEKRLLELQANCLLNSAASHLKNRRYEDALNDCNEALDIDSENAKALFRKGQALHGNRDYDNSLKTLYTALKLAPSDKSINAEIIAVKGEIQAYKAQEKRAFSKLFAT